MSTFCFNPLPLLALVLVSSVPLFRVLCFNPWTKILSAPRTAIDRRMGAKLVVSTVGTAALVYVTLSGWRCGGSRGLVKRTKPTRGRRGAGAGTADLEGGSGGDGKDGGVRIDGEQLVDGVPQ
ncbi:hypothetical protein GQ55_6G125700 [Panicum hallii var. hallii]|uniref:Uncharacterized protein n=1 Tax=Panicum hallii var. hallii TaxID=1504633 RepID=A0A2T7D5Z0_9POAL|nr:hypothetical protein GQ55_6G125700 [Panicum hallii var. hallii]